MYNTEYVRVSVVTKGILQLVSFALQAYQRMADVYIKKAEIAKTKKEASETRKSGFDMYMRAYRLQRTPEVFTSMLTVAVIEGEGTCVDCFKTLVLVMLDCDGFSLQVRSMRSNLAYYCAKP